MSLRWWLGRATAERDLICRRTEEGKVSPRVSPLAPVAGPWPPAGSGGGRRDRATREAVRAEVNGYGRNVRRTGDYGVDT
jgi:hypothetical protein